MDQLCILIPAVKKNLAFADDIVKKLNGKTLLQRVIDLSLEMVSPSQVLILTDSQEVSLVAERNGTDFVYKPELQLEEDQLLKSLGFLFGRLKRRFSEILLLWPYTPLLQTKILKDAYAKFHQDQCDLLVSVREEKHRLFRSAGDQLPELLFQEDNQKNFCEVRGFSFFSTQLLLSRKVGLKVEPFILDPRMLEIRNYQDWWVCEKLLQSKTIVFRVIGYPEVGMGHIYRALAIAHEITDHKVYFLCDEKSSIAVNHIAGYEYWIESYPRDQLAARILALEPDLVINDCLDTEPEYMKTLKQAGIQSVNFEDLGGGVEFCDLGINEIFEEPQIVGDHLRWGHEYFILRDEFEQAKPHRFKDKVKSILITFGGTDPMDLTRRSLDAVLNTPGTKELEIYIVTGGGYQHKVALESYLEQLGDSKVHFTYATQVISSIMEKCQLAICSNGRTVYELAHLNIPSLVISQHEREGTHSFSTRERGFINLGVADFPQTSERLQSELKLLLEDRELRKSLHSSMHSYSFTKNKIRVVKEITRFLEGTK